MAEGAKCWFIPDGYWPAVSNSAYPSHEAICVLNPGKKDASLEITLYFEDMDKMDGFKASLVGKGFHRSVNLASTASASSSLIDNIYFHMFFSKI